MDGKTLQAMVELANKLGTTAEYLWGVLVQQAPLSGTIDLVLMIVGVLGTWAWGRFVTHKTRGDRPEWEDVGAFAAWLAVVLMGISTCVFIAGNLAIAVAALVHPEYWALRQIIQ